MVELDVLDQLINALGIVLLASRISNRKKYVGIFKVFNYMLEYNRWTYHFVALP